MKPPLFSSRTFFVATLTAIVTLTVLGWGFWSFASAQYRRVIDEWIDAGRQNGYQISYDDRQLFGFPRRITMRFTNLHWRNTDGVDFRTDDMDIVVTPWNWSDFDAKFKNHVSVTTALDKDGHSLLLSAGSGHAYAHLDSEGSWLEANLALRDAQVGLAPNFIFQAEKLNAAISRPEVAPKDHSEVGLTLAGDAENVSLPGAMPTPFGNKARKFTTHMRVMGPVPDVRLRSAVDVWNQKSGVVQFDDFTLNWGDLDLASKGTMGFDDDLQPEGAFAAAVSNSDKTIKILIDNGFIAIHDEEMLESALSLFAKPAPHGGGKILELPVTVQLGGLFFGPIRIFTFPEIEWPTTLPEVKS